jgi:hypothetical protein
MGICLLSFMLKCISTYVITDLSVQGGRGQSGEGPSRSNISTKNFKPNSNNFCGMNQEDWTGSSEGKNSDEKSIDT